MGQTSASGLAGTGTLAARMEGRDRDRFVGRKHELEFLESCLSPIRPRACLLHGPGDRQEHVAAGAGRRAEALDRDVYFIEGRELPPMPDALEAVLAARASRAAGRLIDTYERMTALDGYLRRGLVPSLPGRTLVVIADRGRPTRMVPRADGRGSRRVQLTGCRDDALDAPRRHGLSDERARRWSVGRRLAARTRAGRGYGAADSSGTPRAATTSPRSSTR